MTTALTTIEPQRTPSRALIMAETLTEQAEQRKLLGAYIKGHMQPGTDYGIIPNTENKTLFKPGAEKLVDLFRCVAEYDLVTREERWEDLAFFYYMFRCRIVFRDTEVVVAHGVGSCNSQESRYRWRSAARVCPECGKPAIIKGKKEYGGGWICFTKKDGCGAKFEDEDKSIVGQVVGKIENPDIADVANTVLKMAKKRALVDAAISLARCSDLFTQDVEDLPDAPAPEPMPVPAKPQSAPVETSEQVADRTRKTIGWLHSLGESWRWEYEECRETIAEALKWPDGYSTPIEKMSVEEQFQLVNWCKQKRTQMHTKNHKASATPPI